MCIRDRHCSVASAPARATDVAPAASCSRRDRVTPSIQGRRISMHTRRNWLTLAAAIVGVTLAGGASVALAQGKLKVAAVYTVPIEQQWVSRIHKALNAAKDRGEIEYVFSEKVANADYERVMREYAEKGNTLVVGESFAVEAAARKVAKDYPKVSFLMGSSGKPQAPNFAVFDNYIQEPAYLSGMVAGGMTKTHKIGMVGGYPIPEVNRLMHAFMAGAKEVNPKVEFYVTFIGSWFDPPKAKEAAYAMIEKGADILYAERFGVSDAAQEKGELAPLGTFEAKVPKDLAEKVRAKEKAILDGKFAVKVVETEPKTTAK